MNMDYYQYMDCVESLVKADHNSLLKMCFRIIDYNIDGKISEGDLFNIMK
jgi:Ca2+-binding EF-hand superfamily protein